MNLNIVVGFNKNKYKHISNIEKCIDGGVSGGGGLSYLGISFMSKRNLLSSNHYPLVVVFKKQCKALALIVLFYQNAKSNVISQY